MMSSSMCIQISMKVVLRELTNVDCRFGNDRLSQAALSLSESQNVEKMHYIVSQALMKYYHDHRSRYSMAHHVALASRTIKTLVSRRIDYRRILWEAGQTAAQSGARPTALWYFRHCIALLQEGSRISRRSGN